MNSFQNLIRQHDALEAFAKDLLVTVRGAPNAERAIRQRSALAAALNRHLAEEDAEIYPSLMQCTDSATSMTATSFARSFLSLAADWQAYLESWTVQRAAAEWDAFAVETSAILDRLAKRIADENALLYPAALCAGVIRLRE